MLELRGTRRYYASPAGDIRAVDGVSIAIDRGELVAILGPSGSGKTTLLLLAAGLLRADTGSVRFDGRDLSTLRKRELVEYRRTQLGFVFQDFNLVPGLSAEDNVALPLLLRGIGRREARGRARGALGEVGLDGRMAHAPARLSGGEQQRVSIARALVGEPRLVLADEPTGNLDSETGAVILALLSGLPHERGVAMIVVSHDARVTGHADRVLTMCDGKIAERALAAAEARG